MTPRTGGKLPAYPACGGTPSAYMGRWWSLAELLEPEAGRMAGIEPTQTISDQIEQWLRSDGPKTLGSLVELFEEKSFAVIFVLLLAVPALPLPTGGATHVFEIIAMLLSLQLIVGRDEVWLPQRWCRLQLESARRQKFLNTLLRVIRRLERFSMRRWAWLFEHRLTNHLFGVAILLLSIAAFVAPPFSGLDTLPSLGAVVISVGVLLEDFLIVIGGVVIGAGGVLLEVVLGKAAFKGAKHLFSALAR
jgi:hypothetical protein